MNELHRPAAAPGRMLRIQGLRAAAFLGIFACHSLSGIFTALGAWSVSVFLILSGFLMVLSYSRKELPQSSLRFAWSKLRGLYPLHLITTGAMVLLTLLADKGTTLSLLAAQTALHTLLLQIWVPVSKIYTGLNPVCWYLSVSFLCYLLFPAVFRFLGRRITSCRQGAGALLLLVAVQIGISLLAYFLDSPEGATAQWITYYFPPSRFVDFLIGCCLGFLSLKTNSVNMSPPCEHATSVSRVRVWLIQLGVLVLTAVAVLAFSYGPLAQDHVRFTLLFTLPAAALVWTTARYETGLSRLLALAPVVKMGDLSPYAFLIHSVVIFYIQELRKYVTIRTLVVIPLYLAVTFALSMLYARFLGKKSPRA